MGLGFLFATHQSEIPNFADDEGVVLSNDSSARFPQAGFFLTRFFEAKQNASLNIVRNMVNNLVLLAFGAENARLLSVMNMAFIGFL